MAAPPGARATSARGRSSSCSRSSTTRTVKDILRIVFAQQSETRGDWPQWFMLEPYADIRDRHSHGDVIVWPLKALCDYVEATDDLAFLDEPVAWRRDEDFAATTRAGPGRGACRRSCSPPCASASSPARSLIRYGEGDWNDSLQPADPTHARLDGQSAGRSRCSTSSSTATPRS